MARETKQINALYSLLENRYSKEVSKTYIDKYLANWYAFKHQADASLRCSIRPHRDS